MSRSAMNCACNSLMRGICHRASFPGGTRSARVALITGLIGTCRTISAHSTPRIICVLACLAYGAGSFLCAPSDPHLSPWTRGAQNAGVLRVCWCITLNAPGRTPQSLVRACVTSNTRIFHPRMSTIAHATRYVDASPTFRSGCAGP